MSLTNDPNDPGLKKIGPDNLQEKYLVLSEEERAKGFVRPYRDAYRHDVCGAVTVMGRALSETYARDPYFYSGTYCVRCKNHYPVGEFHWYEFDGTEGPTLGE
jgi:hypothetical protein